MIVLTASLWTIEEVIVLEEMLFCMRAKRSITIKIIVFPKTIQKSLPREHRAIVKDRINDFDLFIYQEDDMDLTLSHVNSFVAYTPLVDEMSGNYNTPMTPLSAVGFFRYEVEGHDKFLIDIPNPRYEPTC